MNGRQPQTGVTPIDPAGFEVAFPEYASTRSLDALRARDFARLDRGGQIYLDYTGGGLYADSQIRRHFDLLRDTVFGNPHSFNPTSHETGEMVERCRRRVLDFFRASPDEYALVFTANASHALKLVGESYPFERGDRFLLTYDNHNSVNGIREFDRVHGAETTYVPVVPPGMAVDVDGLDRELERTAGTRHRLFAFPAQSNFSGVQHPLEWIERAQQRGWDVLLDAAAFVPTNRLDLSKHHPQFTALSFYKMFGYPTGVGALIARREALGRLHRPWFAGGTIEVASVQVDDYRLHAGSEAFEDGTLDYTNIPAIEFGLDLIDSVGLDTIHRRVRCLTGWLIGRLQELHHSNGRPLIRLYGPPGTEGRGGTVAINLCNADGELIDHALVEQRAATRRLSIRTGCFCNPGASELALGLSRDQLQDCFTDPGQPMTVDDFRHCLSEKGTGAVRISVGLVSNLEDVEAFVGFAREFLS